MGSVSISPNHSNELSSAWSQRLTVLIDHHVDHFHDFHDFHDDSDHNYDVDHINGKIVLLVP